MGDRLIQLDAVVAGYGVAMLFRVSSRAIHFQITGGIPTSFADGRLRPSASRGIKGGPRLFFA
jgi:hypothetical protein